jgi:predicted cobalt transporter CbtA
VPQAPVANRATDQFTPDQPTPRRLDAETLLAAAPAQSEAVANPAPAAAPAASPIAEAADDGWGSIATWLGVLLIALGLASVLGSNRTLREAILFARFDARTSRSAME